MNKILERYDATALIGLPVVVLESAQEITETDEDGKEETYIHVRDLENLAAASAMVRCLRPRRLRGVELRAIRKIMGMTAREFSEAMGENTAAETISRWENEAAVPGGYAEKLLRLTICEHLKRKAPGVIYDPEKLIRVRMEEFDRTTPMADDPRIELRYMPTQKSDGTVDDSWGQMNLKLAA
jgi:DNA-binding transcriptional regulator YiaG